MKRIVVCGDSFCSASTSLPGTHFSELLPGYEVINLARGGITNTAIGFQIQTAVSLQPVAVIFASTDAGRLDVPLGDFKISDGLKNFIYPYESDASTGSPYVGDLSATIYSDVIPAMLQSRPDLPEQLTMSDELKGAIKLYLAYLHDYNLKSVTDQWLIGYWKSVLKENNIPFINLRENSMGQILYTFVKDHPDVASEVAYHTDKETQIRVATLLNEWLTTI